MKQQAKKKKNPQKIVHLPHKSTVSYECTKFFFSKSWTIYFLKKEQILKYFGWERKPKFVLHKTSFFPFFVYETTQELSVYIQKIHKTTIQENFSS